MSSLRPVRVVFEYFPTVEGEPYVVVYSSGEIRSYRMLPDDVIIRLSVGSIIMWDDGDALVYELL